VVLGGAACRWIRRTVTAVSDVVKSARQLAADREKFSPQELPSHKFQPLWDEEQEFINACRAELELDVMARYGSRAGLGVAQQSGARFDESGGAGRPALVVRKLLANSLYGPFSVVCASMWNSPDATWSGAPGITLRML
jgi:hypothetical protein